MHIQNCQLNENEFEVIASLPGFTNKYFVIENQNTSENLLPKKLLFRVYEFLNQEHQFDSFCSQTQESSNLLFNTNHPNIVRPYGAARYGDFVVEMLEYTEGVSLSDYILETDSDNRDNTVEAKKLILDLINATQSLENLNIQRGCITPKNIIVDSFGRARILNVCKTATVNVFNKAFLAPHEHPTAYYMYLNDHYLIKENYREVTKEVQEVQNLAVIYYQLLTGETVDPKTKLDSLNGSIHKNFKNKLIADELRIISAAISFKIDTLSELKNAIQSKKVIPKTSFIRAAVEGFAKNMCKLKNYNSDRAN